MTPEEALESLEIFGGQSSVPQIYADMGITRLEVSPFDEAALAERLFSTLEKSLEIRHPATPAATPESGDSASGDKGLADAA